MKCARKKSGDKHSGDFVGGYVPPALIDAIREWIAHNPERNQSVFLREAIREKLRRDGIVFREK